MLNNLRWKHLVSLYSCGIFLLIAFSRPAFGQVMLWDSLDFSQAQDMGHTPQQVSSSEVRHAGEITFRNRTSEAGLNNAYGRGTIHGVGIAMVDLNNDDYPDIFIANGIRGTTSYPMQLWMNDGDGTFTDRSSNIPSAVRSMNGLSVAAGDYDNDGDVDLYIGTAPRDVLLRNNGSGSFTDVTSSANAGGPSETSSGSSQGKMVAFGDIDGDGHLDIAVASSRLPGRKAYMLRNRGNGTFEDVTAEMNFRANDGSLDNGNACAMMFSDYDNDGDQDIWIWNDNPQDDGAQNHFLFRNNDGQNFSDVTSSLANTFAKHPMGIDAGDINRDGYLDYYISNMGRDNKMMVNNRGNGFTNEAASTGTEGDFGWGLAFEDFNGDAWTDLFVTQEDDRPYEVYRNTGGAFVMRHLNHPGVDSCDISGTQNCAAAHNVPAAFADYDQDGRTDVAVVTTDGTRLMLFRNETDYGTNRYLDVKIKSTPGTGEAGGISARVAIRTGHGIQFKDITGGASRGSQNGLSARFGLGPWTGVEWVAVLWPDGRQRIATNVEGNQLITLNGDEFNGSRTNPGGGSDPLELANINVEPTANSAVVSWQTNNPANAEVRYGVSGLDRNEQRASLRTSHSITLTDLESGTTYNYRIISVDEDGQEAESPTQTFRTDDIIPPPPVGEDPSNILPNTPDLTDDEQRFTWTAGDNIDEYWITVGNIEPDYANIESVSVGTSTSANVDGIYLTGHDVVVKVWFRRGNIWGSIDRTYTTELAGFEPSPAHGSQLESSTVTFSWEDRTDIEEYYVYAGTESGVGSKELYDSSTTTNGQKRASAVVENIPQDGSPLYLRIWWRPNYADYWFFQDFQYTTQGSGGGTPPPSSGPDPEITSPTPGSEFDGSSIDFEWTPKDGVWEYFLYVGSAEGANNLFGGSAGTNNRLTATGIPQFGGTAHVRLWWYVDGAWQWDDWTYTMKATPLSMDSPRPGATLSGASVTFRWSDIDEIDEYYLHVGTGEAGTMNLFDDTTGGRASQTIDGLPTNGETIYFRLWVRYGLTWGFLDYTFRAATPGPATQPTPLPDDGSGGSPSTVPVPLNPPSPF